METHQPFDQPQPSSDRNDTQNEKRSRHVPPGFVQRSHPATRVSDSGREEHRGAALDERSFASLRRIARYLRLEGVSECSRAELVERIRAELTV
jgi:hypothetical protein